MPALTENEICYEIEGIICFNQNFGEKNPKMIRLMVTKLFYKKRVERGTIKKLLCSLSHQGQSKIDVCFKIVLFLPSVACHVVSEDHFAEGVRLVRKTFYPCKFSDVYVDNEEKILKVQRNQYEIAKNNLRYCYKPNIFALYIKKIPKRINDTQF